MLGIICGITILGAAADTAEAPVGPFAKLTFQEACATAAESGDKQVLVYLSEPDNKQCASFTKSTWTDESLRQWLFTHAVAIEVNAPEHGQLIERYGVRRIPAVLLVSPKGRLLTQVLGFRRPESLLQALEAGRQAEDPIARARKRLKLAGNKPAARIAYAQALEEGQQLKEALEQYLICFDETPESVKHRLGARLLVVEELGRMAADYPPARAALVKRRDVVRRRLLQLESQRGDPQLLAAMNARLGAVDDTLAVYRKLEDAHPDSAAARMVRDSAVDSLIEVKRYAEVVKLIDVMKHFRFAYQLHQEDVARPLGEGKRIKEFRRFLTQQFLKRNVKYYEILIGAERFDEAAEMASVLLQVDDSPATYHLLAAAGLRTGQPVEANAEQARKAVTLSGKPDPATLTTLIRLLLHLGHREEAERVVEESGSKLEDPKQREALNALLKKTPSK